MSRLYAWVISDTLRGNAKTIQGSECITVTVNYGSKKNSKQAIKVYIDWSKEDEKPTVTAYFYGSLETRLQINGEDMDAKINAQPLSAQDIHSLNKILVRDVK